MWLYWAPGHADISGNEIADKLATATAEGEEMGDINTPATTMDIQKPIKDSCKLKWQQNGV